MLGNTGRLQHTVGTVDERLTDDAADLTAASGCERLRMQQ
jgi:hypothetical protein